MSDLAAAAQALLQQANPSPAPASAAPAAVSAPAQAPAQTPAAQPAPAPATPQPAPQTSGQDMAAILLRVSSLEEELRAAKEQAEAASRNGTIKGLLNPEEDDNDLIHALGMFDHFKSTDAESVKALAKEIVGVILSDISKLENTRAFQRLYQKKAPASVADPSLAPESIVGQSPITTMNPEERIRQIMAKMNARGAQNV